ncbi:hypothetical protein EVAR_49240_1 [Eumeta japonica]|uniref:Uncharacterized protein n=1 Tax=Eumeta variegata TaxID=151549 RepID=A0A4C1YC72_EUMVA|nr:hypothetical protein EVAR_49240_1 [Eumeta japonica]
MREYVPYLRGRSWGGKLIKHKMENHDMSKQSQRSHNARSYRCSNLKTNVREDDREIAFRDCALRGWAGACGPSCADVPRRFAKQSARSPEANGANN